MKSRHDLWTLSGKSSELHRGGPSLEIEHRPGGITLVKHANGRRERVYLSERGETFSISHQGLLWTGRVTHPSHSTTDGGGDAEGNLTAQFPGKVRKILAQAGAEAKKGEKLLLIEAMKMEFVITAPSDGKIIRVLVQEGQQITPGQLFVEFESHESDE